VKSRKKATFLTRRNGRQKTAAAPASSKRRQAPPPESFAKNAPREDGFHPSPE
jgi:hypothetical protein